MLVEGPAGWAEFSPFLDYDVRESAPWLAAALDSAANDWPTPLRDRIPVNCTVPAVGPDRAAEIVRRSGCRTAKVKVAEQPEQVTGRGGNGNATSGDVRQRPIVLKNCRLRW